MHRTAFRLALVSLLISSLPQSTPTATAQDFAERADALVDAYVEAGLFNGSVLIGQGDAVAFERATGFGNLSWRVPNATDTRFQTASITKQFTAALVHTLAEDGLLDLDATVSATLPGYPAGQGDRVTLTQLLDHTSGIPNFTRVPAWDQVMRDPVAPRDFLRVFSGLPLQFEPGSRFAYSNSNYFLLGVIVEHVTRQPFMAALTERVLAPLGLDDTGHADGSRVVERLALGYVPVPGGFAPEEYMDPGFPFAAGMLYSTTGDLFRWTRALHADAPFQNAETLTRMLTPGRGLPTGYAHGINVSRVAVGADSLAVVRHGGGIGGFYTEARYYPEREWTVVALDNARGDVGSLSDNMVRLLLGQEPVMPSGR